MISKTMTKREQQKRRRKFAVDGITILTLCKMDALNLGLPKTAKSITAAMKMLDHELTDKPTNKPK